MLVRKLDNDVQTVVLNFLSNKDKHGLYITSPIFHRNLTSLANNALHDTVRSALKLVLDQQTKAECWEDVVGMYEALSDLNLKLVARYRTKKPPRKLVIDFDPLAKGLIFCRRVLMDTFNEPTVQALQVPEKMLQDLTRFDEVVRETCEVREMLYSHFDNPLALQDDIETFWEDAFLQ